VRALSGKVAVVDDRFHILTHDDSAAAVHARVERIVEGRKPESSFG
jgi:hypothetical protein